MKDNFCPRKIQPKKNAETGANKPKLETIAGDNCLIPWNHNI